MMNNTVISILAYVNFAPDVLIIKIPRTHAFAMIHTEEDWDKLANKIYFVSGINIATAAVDKFTFRNTSSGEWVLEVEIR